MITILMATYNGGRYVTEQIESLLRQTEQDFVLRVRDDSSTDDTYSILCGYAAKYPGKIFIEQNPENGGGAKWNFLRADGGLSGRLCHALRHQERRLAAQEH